MNRWDGSRRNIQKQKKGGKKKDWDWRNDCSISAHSHMFTLFSGKLI